MPEFPFDAVFRWFLIGGTSLTLGAIVFAMVRYKFNMLDFGEIDRWTREIHRLPTLLRNQGWHVAARPSFERTLEHPPAGLPPGKAYNRLFLSATKEIGGRQWTLYQTTTGHEVAPRKPTQGAPTISVATELLGAVPGWIRALPASSAYAYKRKADHALESNRFNRRMDVRGSSEQLAFRLLSPDFMDWYERVRPQPWVTVEGTTLLVTYESNPVRNRYAGFEADLTRILRFVESSGAVEKPPKRA